ncbi:MAG: Membrane alanine aminopeptidase [Micavibrio sp.]|nr:Membrane alanine aminopeptidase [Micavibrio sp.]
MRTDTPRTIYLKDYAPFPFSVEDVQLTFRIFPGKTNVVAVTKYTRIAAGTPDLVLNAENMDILSVKISGAPVQFTRDEKFLTIAGPDQSFTLETEVSISPENNTALEGLYMSGGNYCTQCESEGFRKITPFPDRPDQMTIFTVRVEADKKTCPVLLSNGNLVDEGDLDGGRHFTTWHDPFAKPCYLFALVAGDLVNIRDSFTTMSGRVVDLRIYVRAGDESQCDWAMESLKKSMAWDEEVYGREYQLDRFNIVAVSDFNMGAMENTSLNIFNTALVLAKPETATDGDFERVEGVIAHEYFHNWTGNRVTCRDWFQLSLKEGLTVFRDQEFTADMNSRGVKRIDDVIRLRKMQFPEDAGPMAHPIRPDNYIEISNFYTMTVYEKGAEVIRMQHTLLGNDNYRKATDLYFDRYDGMAVTCDDFLKCMEDASGLDLGQFKLWYSQAGTPEIEAKGHYDEAARRYTLTLKQSIPSTPGQTDKRAMHIPVSVGLVGPNGADMATKLLELKEGEQSFVFENIPSRPVPSILRDFSAPVKLTTDLSDGDYRFLMVHDSDGFNRWESGQILALRMLGNMIDNGAGVDPAFIASFGDLVDQGLDDSTDLALLARSLSLPDISIIAQQRAVVDTDAIYAARQKVILEITGTFRDKLQKIYDRHTSPTNYSNDPKSVGKRSLKNVVLGYLLADRSQHALALARIQYDAANNMTDRVAAVLALTDTVSAERDAVLSDFYDRFKDFPLVVDKWFSMQAMAVRPSTIADVRALRDHPAFNILNPNRVRSLYAAFAISNPVAFHTKDGSGYDFLVEAITTLNEKNPQIASRLLTPLREWRRYTPDRQVKMKAALEKILALPSLSPDVFEVVTKSLK